MISFANLGELWAALADATSARTSPIWDPPALTAEWSTDPIASITRLISTLEIEVRLPDSSTVVCDCPLPLDSMEGYREIALLGEWRKGMVVAFDDTSVPANWELIVRNARASILSGTWPSIGQTYMGGFSTGMSFGAGPFNWFCLSYLHAIFDDTSPAITTTPDPNFGFLDGVPDIAIDTVSTGFFYRSGSPALYLTPTIPDDQVPAFDFWAWPGEGSFVIPSPDVNSLNNLADALARGPGLDGSLQTHRSRKMLTVSSGTTELPRATGTSDNMMHRLAIAVRTWLSGSMTLWTRKPNGQVATNRGIIVKR